MCLGGLSVGRRGGGGGWGWRVWGGVGGGGGGAYRRTCLVFP